MDQLLKELSAAELHLSTAVVLARSQSMPDVARDLERQRLDLHGSVLLLSDDDDKASRSVADESEDLETDVHREVV